MKSTGSKTKTTEGTKRLIRLTCEALSESTVGSLRATPSQHDVTLQLQTRLVENDLSCSWLLSLDGVHAHFQISLKAENRVLISGHVGNTWWDNRSALTSNALAPLGEPCAETVATASDEGIKQLVADQIARVIEGLTQIAHDQTVSQITAKPQTRSRRLPRFGRSRNHHTLVAR